MKGQLIFGTMLSAVFAASLAAQQPPNAQPPAGQTPPAGSTQPANPSDTREQKAQTDRTTQTLTVVGCVAPASSQAGAGATTTGAQTGQRGAGYILTNVTAAGSTPGGAGRTAGTSGTPASGTTLASSYRLMSGPDQDLSKYAGQRVEITATTMGSGTTGSAATQPGSPTGTGAGTANPSTTGAPAGAAASTTQGQGTMQVLQVTAVRPATGGGTCTQ